VAAERRWFDIKALHLGHLAKAFELREKPSGMSVQGIRSSGGEKRRLSSSVGGGVKGGGEGVGVRDGHGGAKEKDKDKSLDEAAQKMKRKMREMGKLGASGTAAEFNIAWR
jgi:ATP-dependent RNA helicase DDX31/DBP7